jgi:hypothetical protein
MIRKGTRVRVDFPGAAYHAKIGTVTGQFHSRNLIGPHCIVKFDRKVLGIEASVVLGEDQLRRIA